MVNLILNKSLISSSSYKGVTLTTTTVVTDGNNSGTVFNIEPNTCLYYEFDFPVNIESYTLIKSSGGSFFRFDFYDANGVLIDSIDQPSTGGNVNINGVHGFALFNTRTSINAIYEVSLDGEARPPSNKILLLQNDGKVNTIRKREVSEKTIVPEMTSNTAPSGIASASSIYTSNYNAWKGFNSITGSGYEGTWESLNKNMPQWLSYQFPTSKVIGKYAVQGVDISTTGVDRNPKDWTFEGSNDGVNWIVLDTQVNQTNWKQNEKREFLIENDNSYIHYRIFITANNGGDYVLINVLHLHELINKASISQIPSHSEQNFVKYGVDSPVQVGGLFTNINYVLQDTVSENAEGLWTTQINRKPLSIKFK